MATWVRQGTGTAPSVTNGDLSGRYSLDNGTAPGDFDPAGVTQVVIAYTITGSGFDNDTWDDLKAATLDDGTNIGATINGTDATGQSNNGSNTSETDSSPNTGLSTAQWEAMAVSGGTGVNGSYTTFQQVTMPDGGTQTMSALTVTITYTPATPATMALEDWQFRNHANFTEAVNSATFGTTKNVAPSLNPGRGFRLRVVVQETAGGTFNNTLKLQYRINTGSWADVAVNSVGASNAKTAVAPVEIRQYQLTNVNGTATTQVIGNGTFNNGGDILDSSITNPAVALTSEEIEIEWVLWFHRYWDSTTALNSVSDTDTIEFRVMDGASNVISPSGSNPSLTVDIPDYYIGGLIAENVQKPGGGIHCDSNGNLYAITEVTEVDNSMIIHKSTNGGVTWTVQDYADGPTITDIEGLDSFIESGGNELWIFVHNDNDIKMFRYGLSAHTTEASRDQWLDATGETIESLGASNDPTDQSVIAKQVSTGEVICAYTSNIGGSSQAVRCNIRTGGTWGSPFNVWTGVTNGDRGTGGVLVDDALIVFNTDSVWDLYAKRITKTGSLTDLSYTSTTAAATGLKIADVRQYQPILGAHALSTTSFVIGYLIDTNPDSGKTRTVTGLGSSPSVNTEQASINASNWMVGDVGLSNQPAGTLVRDSSSGDLYAIYAIEATEDAATNTFHYRVSTDDGATWGTETAITTVTTPARGWGDRIQNVVAQIYNRGGTKLGVMYSDASLAQQDEYDNAASFPDWGGFVTGWNWFLELDVGTDSLLRKITQTRVHGSFGHTVAESGRIR